MIKKITKIEKLEACPHQFTRHEFIVSDNIRARVENGIRELTSNFTLSDIRDKGKMVKLTSDEINTFKTKAAENLGISVRTLRNKLASYKNHAEN